MFLGLLLGRGPGDVLARRLGPRLGFRPRRPVAIAALGRFRSFAGTPLGRRRGLALGGRRRGLRLRLGAHLLDVALLDPHLSAEAGGAAPPAPRPPAPRSAATAATSSTCP